MTREEWIDAFEEMGEDAVKIKIDARQMNSDGAYIATGWLADKARKRQGRLRRKETTDRIIDIAALTMATVAAVAAVIAAYLSYSP